MKKSTRYFSSLEDRETGDLFYSYKEWVSTLFNRFPELHKTHEYLLSGCEGETWVFSVEEDPKFVIDYGSWWPNEDDRIWMGVVNDVATRNRNPYH